MIALTNDFALDCKTLRLSVFMARWKHITLFLARSAIVGSRVKKSCGKGTVIKEDGVVSK